MTQPLSAPLRETKELYAQRELSEAQRAQLAQGQHEKVAQDLARAQRLDLAGWIHEQIWDFPSAVALYREIRHYKDALRCGLLSRNDKLLAKVVDDIESDPEIVAHELRSLAQWLQDKHRPEHAAALWAQLKQASEPLALALEQSGDHLAACKALLKADKPAAALDRIEEITQDGRDAQYDALAAQAHWELGDVEQSAYLAQTALSKGLRERSIKKTLACALVSLSYPIGAETILGEVPGTTGALGRYRATGLLPANYAGVAYSAMDRRHLEEVEVHLLLGDKSPAPKEPDPTLRKFESIASAAQSVGHPAIRPIIALDPQSGLLVLPHADGPSLAQLIRPPGLGSTPSRVVAIVLRMAKALLAAQAHGLNHGSLLPAQIVTDAAGRPVLGPFGAQLLSGYSATRTQALDELIHFTAPEHRSNRNASEAGDVYALGRIFSALWTGQYQREDPTAALPWVIRHAQSSDPQKRPSLQVLKDALKELRFDVGTLTQHARQSAAASASHPATGQEPSQPLERTQQARAGIRIDCDPQCSPELLDALCAQSSAGCQSILDREGRRLWLAPWPSGTRRADAAAAPPAEGLDPLEDFLPSDAPPALLEELRSRALPRDWVQLPSAEPMLELVGILSEARAS